MMTRQHACAWAALYGVALGALAVVFGHGCTPGERREAATVAEDACAVLRTVQASGAELPDGARELALACGLVPVVAPLLVGDGGAE